MATRKPLGQPDPAEASNEAGWDGPPPKSIILCSDGTGNSSSKPFKTNVWRMYEAVDLGSDDVTATQVVFYDEGVGNSAIRPLAALGAAFGIGVKTNVLDLYRFLCRNHRPGDRIYAFGFSRGAFTIRMLIALITSQGLVEIGEDGIDEADLARRAADAYRAHIRKNVPSFPSPMWLLLPLWRSLREGLIRAKRHLFAQKVHSAVLPPQVHFVGLWDTVAAYGGPIQEIVRGIDDWVRPLTFPNRKLPRIVERARHALALDDERDAFQPVLWDEPRSFNRDRLQQVWFAGMHADVGGGYPDDSLAHVSLVWMMGEAQAAGLRLRRDKVLAARRTADAFGPMHNSRAGVGVYYRYQPRLVGAFLEPPEKGSESLGDPDRGDSSLRGPVLVDRSVLQRISAGTDGYAPITLPEEFDVVGEAPGRPGLPTDLADNLRKTASPRADRQENIRDLVWARRVLYFLTLFATLTLATMPWWQRRTTERLCTDDRCVLGAPFEALATGPLSDFLPGFLSRWWSAFAALPSFAWGLILVILILNWCSTGAEQTLRAQTRRLWREALAGDVRPARGRSPLRAFRTSWLYQSILGLFKNHLLPTLSGLIILALLAWLAAIAFTQVRLAVGEPRGLFTCAAPAAGAEGTVRVLIENACTNIGRVEANKDYLVELRPDNVWRDGPQRKGGGNELRPAGANVNHLGLPHRSLGWPGWFGTPFRRVLEADYLEPLTTLTPHDPGLLQDAYLDRLTAVRCADGVWRRVIKPAHSGTLAFAVNDAVPPFGRADFFYRGWATAANHGGATVMLREVKPDGGACDQR